jgi:hypothetical protein
VTEIRAERKNRVGLNRKHAAPAELRPVFLRKASLAAKPSVDKINEYSPVFPTGAPGRKIIGHAFRCGTIGRTKNKQMIKSTWGRNILIPRLYFKEGRWQRSLPLIKSCF